MKENQGEFNNPIHDALMKKALGYSHTEVVEEFVSGEEGEIKLNKKRVTTKTDPPDISAIKLLIEREGGVEDLSDEQLEEEKRRLLKLLNETKNKRRRKNGQDD